MKLSVETNIISKRFGEYKAIELIKQAGFDGIDYTFFDCEERLGDNYIEYAKELRKHLDNVGIECVQAHAPSYALKYSPDYDISMQEYLWMVHSVETAAILGAKSIVVHSISVPKGVDFKEYNLRFYKNLIPYCEKFGIYLAVENMYEKGVKRRCMKSKLGSPEELNGMIEKINSPRAVACIDIGHAAVTGYEPEDFIDGVKNEYIKTLHVHDNDYIGDCHYLPYEGEFNWNEIIKALKRAGYNGDMSLEITTFFNNFPKELTPDALKLAAKVGRHLISLYHNC